MDFVYLDNESEKELNNLVNENNFGTKKKGPVFSY